MRFLLFFLTVLLFTFLMHWIVYRQFRFAWNISPDQLWLKIVFLCLSLWYLLSVIIGRRFPNEFTDFNLRLASYWLGFAVYFFLFGILAEILYGLSNIIHLHRFLSIPTATIRQVFAGGGLLVAILISLFAIRVAKGDFVVRTFEVPLNNLSPDLDQTKIVLISDLHIGSVNRQAFAKKVVDAINQRNPSLVLIPGDLADGDPYQLKEKLSPLKQIRSKYGVFWTLGNHEYYTGLQTVQQAMAETHFQLLNNRWQAIADGKLIIAGVNDPTDQTFGGEGIRLDKALNGTYDVPIILLSHQPLYVKEAFEKGVSIMVSGHTHGGQTWPANFIVDGVWEFPRGPYRFTNGFLYVSVGIGTWGPPMRLTQPPELVEIILRSKH
ncbi:MAG: metallophosphoesterase [bacterium]|nr:metallophosphoesterase [bacterium]